MSKDNKSETKDKKGKRPMEDVKIPQKPMTAFKTFSHEDDSGKDKEADEN
ncbi:hypothetical protein [Bilifractor sp. HCP3S3_D3]